MLYRIIPVMPGLKLSSFSEFPSLADVGFGTNVVGIALVSVDSVTSDVDFSQEIFTHLSSLAVQ